MAGYRKVIGGANVPTVHNFKIWDHQRGENVVPERKSTTARIKELGGKIVPGTAEEVDEATIDEHGRYDPSRGQRAARL